MLARLLGFTLAVLALSSAVASADIVADVRRCGAMKDNVERLACYDLIAGLEKAKADVAAALSVGSATPMVAADAWTIQTEASKLDDSASVFASVESRETLPARFGSTYRPRLTLRCMENTTAAILEFDGAFMADSGGFGAVTFRIDKQPAFKRNLTASTDNTALGMWSGGSAIPFIKSLYDGKSLLVQAVPFSESPIMFEFDIAGAKQAVEPLRKACGW